MRVLVRFFEALFDPGLADEERTNRQRFLREAFETYRDRIKALNEDRALQGMMNLVEATLRTNYFAPESTPHRVVFKLDSSKVRELSGPKPHCEIFVHSAELMGSDIDPGTAGAVEINERRTAALDLLAAAELVVVHA